jgi:hypothetical protein
MLLEGQLCSSDEKKPVDSSIELMEAEIDVEDQISKAKSLGILDHSPDDEVEGELVFLQARLLDNAMILKHRYGKFLFVHVFFVSLTLLLASFQNNETLLIPLLFVLCQWPSCQHCQWNCSYIMKPLCLHLSESL